MFMCKYVHMCVGACEGGSPGAGVVGGCEPASMDTGNQTWVLFRYSKYLLATEPWL